MKAFWILLLVLFGSLAASNAIVPISFLSVQTPTNIISGTNGTAYNNSIHNEIHPNFTLAYYLVHITGPVSSSFFSGAGIIGVDNISNASLFAENSTEYNASSTTTVDNPYLNDSWDGENGSQYIDNYSNITTITDSTNYSISTTPSKLADGYFFLVEMINHPAGKISAPAQHEYNISLGGLFVDPSTISACGTVTSGAYTLGAALAGVAAGSAACLNVTGSDTSISGTDGSFYYNLTGTNATNTYGIYDTGFNNSYSNIQIQNYTYDIYINGANNDTLQNETLNSSYVSGAALYLPNGNFTVINGSTFNTTNSTDYGIWSPGTVGAKNITIENSTVWTNGTTGHDIYLQANSNNWTIWNNSLWTTNGNGANGIYFTASTSNNTNITNNTINTTGRTIYATNSYNDTIVSNRLIGNANGYNMDMTASNLIISSNNFTYCYNECMGITGSNEVITSNYVVPENSYGITFAGSNNDISNNTVVGLSLGSVSILSNTGTDDNDTVSNNTLTSIGNAAHGIYISATTNNDTFFNNTINSSSGYGLDFASVNNITATSNTITTTGSTEYGILFGTAYNSTVANNTINTTAASSTGIHFNAATEGNNTFINNTITTSAATANGVFYAISTSNHVNDTWINNTITTTNTGNGFEFNSANNVSLIGNIITLTGSAIAGVYSAPNGITNCSYNTVANNTINVTQAGVADIYMTTNTAPRNNSFWTIQNNTMYANEYGIYLNSVTIQPFTANITQNTINVSGPSAIGIYLNDNGSDTLTNNSIWVNATTPANGVRIASTSGNNFVYFNNFTGGQFFINNSNSTNYFNTTVGGIGEGNIYANYSLYNWTTSNANNWATAGTLNGVSTYPANATNTPGIFTSGSVGNDSGPWIPIVSASASVMVPSALACTNATIGHWVYGNVTFNDTNNATNITVWNASVNPSSVSVVNFSNGTQGTFNLTIVLNVSSLIPATPTINITANDTVNSASNWSSVSCTIPDPNKPTLTAPTITPNPGYTTSTFTCNPGIWADADGDLENVSAEQWNWSINGVYQPTQYQNVLSVLFHVGDNISCNETATNSTWTTSNVTSPNSANITIIPSFAYNSTAPVQTLAVPNNPVRWDFQVNVNGSGICLPNISQNQVLNLTTIVNSTGASISNNGNQTNLNFSCVNTSAPYNVTFYTEPVVENVYLAIASALGSFPSQYNLMTVASQNITYNLSINTAACRTEGLFMCNLANFVSCDPQNPSQWTPQSFNGGGTSLIWQTYTQTSNNSEFILTCINPTAIIGGGSSSASPPNATLNSSQVIAVAVPAVIVQNSDIVSQIGEWWASLGIPDLCLLPMALVAFLLFYSFVKDMINKKA